MISPEVTAAGRQVGVFRGFNVYAAPSSPLGPLVTWRPAWSVGDRIPPVIVSACQGGVMIGGQGHLAACLGGELSAVAGHQLADLVAVLEAAGRVAARLAAHPGCLSELVRELAGPKLVVPGA